MKKLFFSICLLAGVYCFSQSMTQKYNSISNQYEYFDSSGNLVGYKKYNSISKQWEFYDLSNSYSNNQPLQRKPYQYRDPGEVDMSATFKAQSTLQNRLDNNKQLFKSELKNIRYKVESMDISADKKQKILGDFNNFLSENTNLITTNLSSSNGLSTMVDMVYAVLDNFIKDANNTTIEPATKKYESGLRPKRTMP